MKNISQIILTLVLLCFSFYYTKFVSNIFIDNSVIMKKIKLNKKNYEYDPVPATVYEDFIIPGVSGRVVDVDKSYNKMIKYGSYNDKLLVFKKVYDKKTINNNYLKYINQARSGKSSVSFIYTVVDDDNIDNILKVLNDNNIKANFFIDGVFLKNNKGLVFDIIDSGHQVEILSYNNSYDDIYFKDSIKTLNEIKKSKALFCYSDYKNEELLKFCSLNKIHTILPTINIRNNLFINVKNNLKDGILIKMPNNTLELSVTISYIKQRGYKIDTLKNILRE